MTTKLENVATQARAIRKTCDKFVEQNRDEIFDQLEKNRNALDENLSEIKIPHIGKNSWGVYVFYIKPKTKIKDLEALEKYWYDDGIGYSPAVIKGNCEKATWPLTSEQSTSPFYVGKSHKLEYRIQQHIHQKTKPSTYGLKLSAHKQLCSVCTFEYSYIVMEVAPDSKFNNEMECLLVTLEKHLRGELKPLVGKQ